MPASPPPHPAALRTLRPFLPAMLLLLLLQSLLPVAAATASPLPPPLPLLNQDVLVQVSLLLTIPPPPHPIPVDLRFTCASTSAALTLNSTCTLHPSSSVRGEALPPKQKKAQPAWAFAVDRHQLQTLQPCWVTAHAVDPPRQQLGLKIVSPPATAMQLSVVLKINFSSSTSPSSSPFSLPNSWLSTIKQQTHHAHTQLLELLITQGWLRRGELIAEDVLALFLFVLLFVCFSVVMGGVILTWVRGKEEEAGEEEEEENEQPTARVKRTSLLPSSLALVPVGGNIITTTQRRRNSSNSSSNRSNNQLVSTTTTSSKKRGSTATTATATRSPPGDASSSLFLDVSFSTQWHCVVYDRRATPTLLKDRDLDAVAAAAAAAAAAAGGGRKGRQQQEAPVAKDVVTRLLADDHKLRGVVLSAKT